jgi:WD40 repeat protein
MRASLSARVLASMVLSVLSAPNVSATVPVPDRRILVLQAPPVISVNSVAVSTDGSLVAAGADGVRLYDARTGALLRALGDSWDQKGPGGRGVAFAPDGRTLAAAGFHRDKRVGIFDVQTGKRLQNLAGHTEWEIDAVAFSPDGKLLASTGVDKQILVWELATGKLRHRLADQPSRAPALAFSPDSATLASGGNKTIRLWDVATGRLRRSLPGHRDWVCSLASRGMARRSPAVAAIGPTTAGATRRASRRLTRGVTASGSSGTPSLGTSSGP